MAALIEERARLWEAMKALNDLAKEGNRDFSAEEQEQWEKMSDEIDSLDARIERDKKVEERQKEYDKPVDELVEPDLETASAEEERDNHWMFRDWLRHGPTPENAEYRALQGDLDPAGGYLIPDQQYITDLVEAVRDESFMRGLSTVRTLGKAESLVLPRLGTRPEDATWQGEITSADEDTALDFDLITITPAKSAKLEKVSMDLLDDSPLNVEGIVREQFAYKFGITEEKGFLTGNGALQPLGVFTASAMGISTARDYSTGNTITTVVADNLIGQTENIKGQYMRNATWIGTRTFKRNIRQLKDGNGQYLWMPGLASGEPGTLLGRPLLTSEYVPDTWTTGLYVAILGDFKRGYTIVDKMTFTLQRLVEIYARTHQIGLLGRMRVGGAPILEEAFTRVTLG